MMVTVKNFVLILFFTFYFDSSFSQNIWQAKSAFPGIMRRAPATFSIGGNIYIACGADSFSGHWTSEVWEYNPTNDSWLQKTNFPGIPRWGSMNFSIAGKGYMVMGSDSLSGQTSEVWEYNPANDSWLQKNSFPGASRYGGAGFSIGNKGFIGMGEDWNGGVFLNDFWEYNSFSDTWQQRPSIGGPGRSSPIGFSIGSKGYVGTGEAFLIGGQYVQYGDFWEYDTISNTWSQKNNFKGNSRAGAISFSIGNRGYIGNGFSSMSTGTSLDFWEYNPTSDSWRRRNSVLYNFSAPIGMECGNKGYIGLGQTNQLWEYSQDTILTECAADFAIYPSNTPQNWNLYCNVTGVQPINYAWDWGDSTYSNTPAPIHTYSVEGFYTIKLTIIDSTGCTSSYSSESYFYRYSQASSMVNVNVINPLATGIKNTARIKNKINFYPNPTNSIVKLETGISNGIYEVTNIYGERLMTNVFSSDVFEIDLSKFSSGMYFVSCKSNNEIINCSVIKQ